MPFVRQTAHPTLRPSGCSSVHLSVFSTVLLSLSPSTKCPLSDSPVRSPVRPLSLSPPVRPYVCPPARQSLCASLRLLMHPSVHRSVHSSTHLSIFPSVYPSVSPSVPPKLCPLSISPHVCLYVTPIEILKLTTRVQHDMLLGELSIDDTIVDETSHRDTPVNYTFVTDMHSEEMLLTTLAGRDCSRLATTLSIVLTPRVYKLMLKILFTVLCNGRLHR